MTFYNVFFSFFNHTTICTKIDLVQAVKPWLKDRFVSLLSAPLVSMHHDHWRPSDWKKGAKPNQIDPLNSAHSKGGPKSVA